MKLILVFFLSLLSRAEEEDEQWNDIWKDNDKFVENYNLMYDSDDLMKHMGKIGTESDMNYPPYFNQDLDHVHKKMVKRKVKKMKKYR